MFWPVAADMLTSTGLEAKGIYNNLFIQDYNLVTFSLVGLEVAAHVN